VFDRTPDEKATLYMGRLYHAARPLLNVLGMAASTAKIICFACRQSTCGCVADLNRPPPDSKPRSDVARAFAWLGGACVAGSALGAALAFLLGG